jgi:hypothetical protein
MYELKALEDGSGLLLGEADRATTTPPTSTALACPKSEGTGWRVGGTEGVMGELI